MFGGQEIVPSPASGNTVTAGRQHSCSVAVGQLLQEDEPDIVSVFAIELVWVYRFFQRCVMDGHQSAVQSRIKVQWNGGNDGI